MTTSRPFDLQAVGSNSPVKGPQSRFMIRRIYHLWLKIKRDWKCCDDRDFFSFGFVNNGFSLTVFRHLFIFNYVICIWVERKQRYFLLSLKGEAIRQGNDLNIYSPHYRASKYLTYNSSLASLRGRYVLACELHIFSCFKAASTKVVWLLMKKCHLRQVPIKNYSSCHEIAKYSWNTPIF